MRIGFDVFAVLAVLIFAASASAQTESFPYSAEAAAENSAAAPAPMRADMHARDGVLLAADVHLPAGAGPWPVILLRTPYLRAAAADAFGASYWTARGYAFVTQDARGKGDSEGVFEPWENEAQDGFDAVEWAARQSWSNGRVGMLGGSYLGAVQWAAASQQPPSLRALAVLPAIADPFFGGAYDSGVFSLAPFWPYENAARAPRPLPEHDPSLVATLPLERVDDTMFGADVPIWNSYVARPLRVQWRAPRWPEDVCRVQAPTLVFMALWDGDGIGPVLNWQALQSCDHARRALVFGPWPHSMNQRGRRGDVIYGEGAQVDWIRIIDNWFEAELKRGSGETPVARAFVTGENRWRTFEAWPPVERQVRFILGGDLSLSPSRGRRAALPLRSGADIGTSRTLSDAGFNQTTILPAAPADEQLVFTTAPMTETQVLGGAPLLHLTVRPSADDADIFAFPVVVSADGEMRVLAQPGKLRLSYRRGADRRVPLPLHRDVEIDIRLQDFAHSFAPGERFGIALRTEWFPRWARNTGAGPLEGAATVRNARHLIRVGGRSDSAIVLSRLD